MMKLFNFQKYCHGEPIKPSEIQKDKEIFKEKANEQEEGNGQDGIRPYIKEIEKQSIKIINIGRKCYTGHKQKKFMMKLT